nr:hemin uptake protein HemP [Rhizobium sp. BK251]
MSMKVKIIIPSAGSGSPAFLRKNQTEMVAEKLDTHKHLPARTAEPAAEVRVLESTDIFRGQSEIMIRHEGAVYRMKITRQGKLILNK